MSCDNVELVDFQTCAVESCEQNLWASQAFNAQLRALSLVGFPCGIGTWVGLRVA